MSSRVFSLSLCFFAWPAISGCGGEDPAKTVDPLDEEISVTEVRLHEDGTETVWVEHMTQRERFEQEALREHGSYEREGKLGTVRQGILKNAYSPCNGNTAVPEANDEISLYGQDNYAGNVICFWTEPQGQSYSIDLASHLRLCVGPPFVCHYWDYDVRSYKSRDYPGRFKNVPGTPPCSQSYSFGVNHNNPNSGTEIYRYLGLGAGQQGCT